MTQTVVASGPSPSGGQPPVRLHVVFNNLPYKDGLETSWGFACLVETPEENVLFDTGGRGDILLANMARMDLAPEDVDAVVLSHIHGDHTGGLEALLAHRPGIVVYMPASFPATFQNDIRRLGVTVATVTGPQRLLDDIHSTGEMGQATREQALIVGTAEGAIVITGCAHPDVADMVERARTYLGKDILLVMGGFHLGGRSDTDIRAVIRRLKTLGVQKVAPSHCTGDRAIALFRAAWGDDFIDGGLGAVIAVPTGHPH